MKDGKYTVLIVLILLTVINASLCIWLLAESHREEKAIAAINKNVDQYNEKRNNSENNAGSDNAYKGADAAETKGDNSGGENKTVNDDFMGNHEDKNNNVNINESGDRVTLSDGFYYEKINDALKEYITGKSYKENDKISYDDLRHVVVDYVNFDGQTCSGELIVNAKVAEDVVAIFKELYDVGYQIEKIRLVDEYNADDDASMADNNTSAFNYRVIDGTDEISDHGYGIAIDINPLYNPYVRTAFGDRNVLPVNGAVYADRTTEFEHKIEKGDVCYNAFISRGWKWGGEWDSPIDYQHFYKEVVN